MRNLMDAAKPQPTQEDIEEVWDCYLDLCSMQYISDNKVDLPVREIKKILAGPMPEKFKGDPRLLPYHYNMVPLGSGLNPLIKDGSTAYMVFVKVPRRTSGKVLNKGLNAIERDAAVETVKMLDFIENEIAERFIFEKGYPGYEIDKNGGIKRLGSWEPRAVIVCSFHPSVQKIGEETTGKSFTKFNDAYRYWVKMKKPDGAKFYEGVLIAHREDGQPIYRITTDRIKMPT